MIWGAHPSFWVDTHGGDLATEVVHVKTCLKILPVPTQRDAVAVEAKKNQGTNSLTYYWWFRIRRENQLRLVVYSIIYDGFYKSQVVQDFFHQQYLTKREKENHHLQKYIALGGDMWSCSEG